MRKFGLLILFVVLISVGTGSAYAINITLGGSVFISQILDMTGNRITNVGNPIVSTDAATKAYVDQAPSTNSYLLQFGSAEGLQASLFTCQGDIDTFFPMDFCTTVVPVSGNISKLTAVSTNDGSLVNPGGIGLSYTVTLFKNGISTSLSCVISNTSTSCNDSIHQVSVSQGDLIDVQVTGTGSVNFSWISASAILTP